MDFETTSTPTKGAEYPKVSDPVDTKNLAYLLMFLFGIGSLLPWNAVLNAFDFFDAKMPEYTPSFVFPFAVNGLLTVV